MHNRYRRNLCSKLLVAVLVVLVLGSRPLSPAEAAWGGMVGPEAVISPAGTYLGTFAPGEIGMPLALGPQGLAAFLGQDDTDVQTVIVAKLPWAVR